MNIYKRSGVAAAVAAALCGFGSSAQAAGAIKAGDWDITLSGNVNAFFVQTNCSASDLDAGGGTLAGLACLGSVDENGNITDSQSVQNGLLPASLNFTAATKQNDWDISANINVYYGISSSGANGDGVGVLGDTPPAAAQPDGLKFSSVDARQIFLTFGKDDFGTVKMGRDFGLFGFDAIINDMTLLGVGANFVASDPGHTSLGGLGYGYVYTDRLTQINYTTTDMNGFSATVGIFQPMDGNGATSAGSVGLHGKASYSWKGDMPGTVSATFINQSVNSDAGTSEDIQGIDLFGKISVGAFGGSLYYFSGEGMSTLALGGLVFPGFNPADGTPEEVSGYMLQGTYQANPVTRVGLNLSKSEQEEVFKVENTKTTLGVYYNLAPSLTLLGEYSQQESDVDGVGTDKSSNITLGSILFF